MYISEIKFNLKPGIDFNEARRLFDEMALPTYRKIPGLLFMTTFKYTEGWNHDNPRYIGNEWEYVHIEVYESKEAIENAHRNDLYSGANAWFQKFMEIVEKYSGTHATEIATEVTFFKSR
jgi:quinol monooxygenase YgiN